MRKEKRMKVRRQIEMKVNTCEIGDQIKVKILGKKYTATAIQRREEGMLFLLDQYLDEAKPMNKEDSTEGGYEASDMRIYLIGVAASLPKKLRKHIVPFEEGYLMTLLSIQEMFGLDENFDKCEGQIPWMKDRRHRIAFRKGENEWGWLRSVYSATNFCYVNNRGAANSYSASYAIGVRPAFILDL